MGYANNKVTDLV